MFTCQLSEQNQNDSEFENFYHQILKFAAESDAILSN